MPHPQWRPAPDWPTPPPDWVYWVPTPPPAPIRIAEPSRRGLAVETWLVLLAFLLPGVVSAVDTLVARLGTGAAVNPIPTIVTGHPVENLVLAAVSYTTVGVTVPLALLLLSRTGQGPAALGLRPRGWGRDLLPGLGLAAAGYAAAYAVTLPLARFITAHKALFGPLRIGHVPAYYLVYGVTAAAVTAISEETVVSGYLLTRLEQFGWSPGRALLFSLTLRTSYHVYYGLGFFITIPIGYFLTRSFQKHRRLARPIFGHFLYDAAVFTIIVLTSAGT